MNINWIEIKGAFSKIDGGNISYFPPTPKIIPENQENRPSKPVNRTSKIKSSIFFENGIIEFAFTVKRKGAYISVGLNDDNLLVCINSTISKALFSIRESKIDYFTDILDSTGVHGNLRIDEEYKFRLEVIGATIIFYINDVVVATTVYQIKNTQIILSISSQKEVIIRDFHVKSKKPKAFIVMQFTDEYNELYKDVIKNVCESYGYECIRADEFYHSNLILNDIIDSIKEAAIIIADITPDNPNVFYELGYSHALNKPTIILSDKKRVKLPFDVSGFRTLFYDNTIGGKSKVEENLKKHLDNLKNKI